MYNLLLNETTDYKLVEPVLDDTINYLQDKLLNFFWILIDMLMNDFEANSTYFYDKLGVTGYTDAIFNVFFWIATTICLLVFVFTLVTIQFGPVLEQKNDMVTLCIRFIISLGMIVGLRPFYSMLNDICDTIILKMKATLISSEQFTRPVGFLEAAGLEIANIVFAILNIILMIGILFEFIKTLLEFMERYLVVQLLLVASPVSGATFVSRSTSSITSNYARMYVAQLFLLIMNRLFMTMFLMMCITGTYKSPIGCLFIMSLLRCGQRLDNYMKSLGLSVAQTGGNLLYSAATGVMALGLAMKGMGGIGNTMENLGAQSGNFKFASFGSNLKSVAKGQIPTKEANLSTFAKNGGIYHPKAGDEFLAKTGSELFKQGNYGAMAQNMTVSQQTQALKAALKPNGEDGKDLFKQATGIPTDNITQASISRDGTIKGMFTVTDKNGESANIAFTASPGVDPRLKTSGVIRNMGDKLSRGVNITPLPGTKLDGMKFDCNYSSLAKGQMSITSSVTGNTIDNELYGELGVTQDTISGNTIISTDNDGNVMAAVNINTGTSYHMGTDSIGDNYSIVPDIKNESDIFDNDAFTKYMPAGAVYEPNTFKDGGKNDGVAFASWKAGTDTGSIYISRPTPDSIRTGSKAQLVNLGPEHGYYQVRVTKKRQSPEIIPDTNL